MAIQDAEENEGRRVYAGSLVEQLDAHAKWWAETHGEDSKP